MEQKKIGTFIIRADGNAKIGAGHLMRCMTIAEAGIKLSEGKNKICFFCADEDSAAMVQARGFECRVLHTDYREMHAELPVWKELCAAGEGNTGSAVILVDSYYVTEEYLRALHTYGQVYLMDDMQTKAYPADGVINYNIFADSAKYERLYLGRQTRLLLGKEYVPLREQFREAAYKPAEQVKNVLITTGGGDADNIAGAILDVIYRPELTYHVLVGRFSPHLENWRQRALTEGNIRIHVDVQNMAELMKNCDLAVTASGSTVYELAAVGVPFLCFSYAENQEALAACIGMQQIAGYAGAWHLNQAETVKMIGSLFGQLCANRAMREKFSAAEKALVDGRGAQRIAAELFKCRTL